MTITIEDSPVALLELLWVREAWGLDPGSPSPPPLLAGPVRLRQAPGPAEWERAWPELWEECVLHAAVDAGPILQRLLSTADASPERAELLDSLLGPSWHRRFGDESVGEPFAAWQQERHGALLKTSAVPIDETPERRSLDALVPAWEAGLTKVVTIPCRGEYTRVVAESTLIITEADRREPDRYADALATFRRSVEEGGARIRGVPM